MRLENRQDRHDLRHARNRHKGDDDQSCSRFFGPGLITGAADDDPSGIGTYSIAGASYGYGLLWLTPLTTPLMIAVQEMSGRIGRVCGCGIAAVLARHYPHWILYGVTLLLIIANLFNIYADLNVMAASMQMLFGVSFFCWLTLITFGMIAAQVLIPYHRYVGMLKWLSLALGAYVVTALLPSVPNDWSRIAHDLVIPSWQWNSDYIMTIVGYLGTTISPYLFFWQAGEEVEEEIAEGRADAPGQRKKEVSAGELRTLRIDTSAGMIISQIICFFIITCAASTLHASGITDINTAQDAARALLPLGKSAYWLFTLGMLGTGLIAIPTLAGSTAYAVAEIFGWRYGLYRRFSRARAFYGVIIAMVLAGYGFNFVDVLSPIKALFYSAVLNGVVTFPLIIALMLICNNRAIVKEHVNGWLSNLFGGIAAVLMGLCVAFMMWFMFHLPPGATHN